MRGKAKFFFYCNLAGIALIQQVEHSFKDLFF